MSSTTCAEKLRLWSECICVQGCESHYKSSQDELMDLEMEGLFSFRGLYMSNDEPDIRVIEFDGPEDVYAKIGSLFGEHSSSVVEIVAPNKNVDVDFCPRFYMFVGGYRTASAPNWKFETFLRSVGEASVDARCKDVLVIGATSEWMSRRFISIPERYYYHSMEIGAVALDVDGMASSIDVLGIPGMSIPCYLPENVQMTILSYCRSPCAEIISDYNTELRRYWDSHFCALSWFVSA